MRCGYRTVQHPTSGVTRVPPDAVTRCARSAQVSTNRYPHKRRTVSRSLLRPWSPRGD